MFKIINNIQQINEINNAVKLIENNNESNYCSINKHVSKELYVIPIMYDYLLSLNLSFITHEWLSTDIINEMPSDWSWHYDKKQRLIIPAKLALTDFSEYINYVKSNSNLCYHIDDNATAYVYFNEIREEDKPVLDYYINNNLIKFEENPVKNITLIIE